tara:strand:+ start:43 stop:189 length:147 start_codon:yes stop_codon:yes gene_type:complete
MGKTFNAFANQKLQTFAVRKCDKKQEPGFEFIKTEKTLNAVAAVTSAK